jgi:hypothetical protein
MRERAGPVSNGVTPQSRRGYRPCMATVIKAVAGDLGNSPVPIAEIPQLVECSASRCRG